MGKRSKSIYLTVKIPIMNDRLSNYKIQQLEHITRRDTTIIKRYLMIIDNHAPELWLEKYVGERIDSGKLDHLTLTTRGLKRTNKQGIRIESPPRLTVPYDLKQEFAKRVTVRELKNCRDTAIAMYESYLTKIVEHETKYWKFHTSPKYIDDEYSLARTLYWWTNYKKPALPCYGSNYTPKKLPRTICSATAKLHSDKTNTLSKWWFEVYSTQKKNKQAVQRLWLPLRPAEHHQKQLARGTPKSYKLVKNANKRWSVHISVQITLIPLENAPEKPEAVVGFDFGMNRAVTSTLLRKNASVTRADIRIFTDSCKKRALNSLDRTIARLQHKMMKRKEKNQNYKHIARKLRTLRHKRTQLSEHYDHELTQAIVQYCAELQTQYRLQIAIGKLQGIRNSRWKGDGKSRKHRKWLHRWSYGRITKFLTYKLELHGFSAEEYQLITEYGTSQFCSKCSSKNTYRPCQSLLICRDCKAELNADINAAINIASKLITSRLQRIYVNAVEDIAHDQWLTNHRVKAWMRAMGIISTPFQNGDESDSNHETEEPVKKNVVQRVDENYIDLSRFI